MPFPTLPPIEITQGQDGQITVTLTDADGNPVDVTGFAFQLTIREAPDFSSRPSSGDSYLRQLDVDVTDWTTALISTSVVDEGFAQGIFGLTVTRAAMSDLSPGRARYVADIWRTDSGETYPVWGPVWVTVVSPAYPPA